MVIVAARTGGQWPTFFDQLKWIESWRSVDSGGGDGQDGSMQARTVSSATISIINKTKKAGFS